MGQPNHVWRVALSIVPSSDNQVRMIRGVLDFARDHPDFRIAKDAAIPFVPITSLNDTFCDGVVAYAETPGDIETLVATGLPAVNVTLHCEPQPALPVVHSDNRLIGKMAADHLLELGLESLVYVGHSAWCHDHLRWIGFRDAATARNVPCARIDIEYAPHEGEERSGLPVHRERLVAAIARVQSPVGIAAAHDEFAFEVIEACSRLGRRVPHDVAVVGVNDYKLICETTAPPLTSIRQRSEAIGYEAATLLFQMLNGGRLESSLVCIPPEGLTVRGSSDFTAISDQLVLAAVDFIRHNCHRPIRAEDVAARVGIGRRALDNRFMASLRQTVAAELRHARIQRAKKLLRSSDLDVVDIAIRCGFDSKSGFTRAFQRETGGIPSGFRQRGSS